MGNRVDVVVIGSGFGGAVTACRLAQSGAKVLVLERGRRWTTETYPRAHDDPWLYSPSQPQRKNGWLDVRHFRHMVVAQGAGVGGGSLCYSSVILPPNPQIFDEGWPAPIQFEDLQRFFDLVRRMLGVRTIPEGQRTTRNHLLRDGAVATGQDKRLFDAPLAISFDDDLDTQTEGMLESIQTKAKRNEHGKWQGSCTHLGNCDIGCNVQAKNTLDLNYLASAENWGADIRPLHIVRCITPDSNGYCVSYDRIADGKLIGGSVEANRVVMAAGSLGSTELLLRCRDQFQTLPKLSQALGKNWTPNGNVLTPAIYADGAKVRQSTGPTISAGLNYSDGSSSDGSYVIEDDGFPNVLFNAMRAGADRGWLSMAGWSRPGRMIPSRDDAKLLSNVMVWLGAGRDEGGGTMRLTRSLLTPWQKKLNLAWNPESAIQIVETILERHRALTEATGGTLKVPKLWRWFRTMITVHPLGGCAMADSIDSGVVNHRGEVFEYPGLYVCDGAMIPKAIGLNPSLTIAAIAERNASLMCARQTNSN